MLVIKLCMVCCQYRQLLVAVALYGVSQAHSNVISSNKLLILLLLLYAGPAGWPSAKDASVTSLQIEHCLMVPELLLQQQQQSEQQQQQRHRVKVVQKFERKDGNWEFTAVELHREKYVFMSILAALPVACTV